MSITIDEALRVHCSCSGESRTLEELLIDLAKDINPDGSSAPDDDPRKKRVDKVRWDVERSTVLMEAYGTTQLEVAEANIPDHRATAGDLPISNG